MILSINSGSSSIKFAVYKAEDALISLFYGEIESLGTNHTILSFTNTVRSERKQIPVNTSSYNDAVSFFIEWLPTQQDFNTVKAIGHRIVHGMQHTEPERITADLLKYLKGIIVYDSEHLPQEIKLIELFTQRFPNVIQIACFDTEFHSMMPMVAKLLSIPRRYFTKGIQRYGFHGLSYAFLMEELERLAGKKVADGKLILAHLGSGASLAAVKEGKSMDTSMGFTASSGLIMSSRTGDLDPGVATYLMQVEKLSPQAYSHLVNHESGLLGLSETSSGMRELLTHTKTDSRAAQAVELFCYQTKKWIGSFTAVLDGLDTLVFSGGIGEHSPEVRTGICSGLTFLGVELDELKNKNNEAIISTGTSRVTVRVMMTNEELMIARIVYRLIKK